MIDWNARNPGVIEKFRRDGGWDDSVPMLLLTTIGRKSGKPYTNPLRCIEENGRLAVFASKGGEPADPDWYHNLVANPKVQVEFGGETFEATASTAPEPDRQRLYALQVERSPNFGDYQAKTSRKIPVVFLDRVKR